jgi:lauroyl/myristoyl acyltransferase
MKKFSYRVATYFSQHLGMWFFRTFSWFIATGYFFLFPTRVAESLKFYRALFPERNFLYHLYCAWQQYHNFTNVFLNHFLLQKNEGVDFASVGWEHLEEAVKKKTGAIIVMSHAGNWELAAQLMNRKGLPVMLYLGEKHKEQIERLQKETLAQINFLREGGIVSMTGDRLWGEQSYVTVEFLGHEARLPDTPHLFALMTGAPLMTFFVYQDSAGKYHIKVSEGRKVVAVTRADRKKAVLESAQAYADDLARFVADHPFEWYHFEPFLGGKINQNE